MLIKDMLIGSRFRCIGVTEVHWKVRQYEMNKGLFWCKSESTGITNMFGSDIPVEPLRLSDFEIGWRTAILHWRNGFTFEKIEDAVSLTTFATAYKHGLLACVAQLRGWTGECERTCRANGENCDRLIAVLEDAEHGVSRTHPVG